MGQTPEDAQPVIVTVAPCGAEVTRLQNPAVPYSPEEIAAEVAEAASAGAAIAHLHVRETDGTPTHRVEVFSEAIARIREGDSNVLCNVSTGGAIGMTIEQRIECLAAGAELAGVETGSLNFAGEPFVTSGGDTGRVIAAATSHEVLLEAECFDLGHVAEAARLQRETPALRMVNLVLGVPGGAPATITALQAMIELVTPGTPWTVTAVGRHQWRMLAFAVLLGAAGIRVGFEDNVYLRRGRLAVSNAELVKQAVDLCALLGRAVATPNEVRERLGIGARDE
jgi:3-keto-5-aminohexanoate cleavage enzyme